MQHTIFKTEIDHHQTDSIESIIFGAGCFWGVERKFWSLPGVVMTSVGYAGGDHPNPTYQLVCSGVTGHAEVVRIDYDPSQISLMDLLKVFWECHDPTQGMRQGNDVGTQYRSGIYYSTQEEKEIIDETKAKYQSQLDKHGLGKITTEVKKVESFFYAEHYHQQYLAKNPDGYCALAGTGVKIN